MTKYYEIIKRPIITEKTTKLAEAGVYTFEVDKNANKIEIANAIEEIFKVKVVAVNTINVLPKKKTVGRYSGFKAAYAKAMVKLQAGDKIEGFTI
jgi:large subunit ribosomal protein L23